MGSPDFTKLQPKQRLYIQHVVAGKSKAEAKRLAGYAANSNTARIETPSIKAAFSRLVRQYVPAHVLAAKVAEGLEAQETKFFQFEGRVTDSKEVINWTARHNYAKLAAEFGGYVESGSQNATAGAQIEVNVRFVGSKNE